jgi:hypothetical protein
MNAHTLPTAVAGIGAALCVAELFSFVQLTVQGGPDNVPAYALVFAALFALGALLIRWRRVVVGTIVVAVPAAFEVVTYPRWAKHGTFDWVFDTTIAVVSLAGVCLALAVLVTRRSLIRAQSGPSVPSANV